MGYRLLNTNTRFCVPYFRINHCEAYLVITSRVIDVFISYFILYKSHDDDRQHSEWQFTTLVNL